MRLSTSFILTILASGLAAASETPKNFTYLHGNLASLSANSEGTVSYSDGKNVELKTPLQTIAIPYLAITSVELGDVHSPAPDPLYKIWSLHKRFSNKSETQEITVTFKDKAGKEQILTLELAREDAAQILLAVQDRNGTVETGSTAFRTTDGWWGDRFWRTTRNANQWTR